MNRIELCRQLTAIDSSVSHGNRDIVEFIAGLARDRNLTVEIHNENYNGIENANILLFPRGAERKKHLLFVSRLDTRDPGDYGHWVRTGANPFNASVDGERLFGLGVADAKADFVCKMLALLEVNTQKTAGVTPVVVGTYGLSSGAGTIRLIRKKRLSPVAALVGAPTELKLARKGPGFAQVEIAIPFTESERDYRRKHDLTEGSETQSKIFSRREGLTFDFFDNPILKLMDYLKNLPSGISVMSIESGAHAESEPQTAYLEVDLTDNLIQGISEKILHIGDSLKRLSAEFKTLQDADCQPSYSTITLGMARTYPEEIKLTGVCRLIPSSSRDAYEPWLDGLRHSCDEVGATFKILDYKPPFITDSEAPFFNFLKGVSSNVSGLNSEVVAARHCTEANVLSRMGVESFVFGPGQSMGFESASKEHVNLRELELAQGFYKTVMEQYSI